MVDNRKDYIRKEIERFENSDVGKKGKGKRAESLREFVREANRLSAESMLRQIQAWQEDRNKILEKRGLKKHYQQLFYKVVDYIKMKPESQWEIYSGDVFPSKRPVDFEW